MKIHRITPCSFAIVTFSCFLSVAVGQHWQIKQIAERDQGGYFPQVAGNRAVWQRFDGNDLEIYLYDGSIVTQLTNNTIDETEPDVFGDHIAWYSGEYDDTDIVYDGKIVMEGVKNTTDMRLGDGGLVWSAFKAPYVDEHVFLFDGMTTRKLSVDGTRHNHNPDMSGKNVVWSGFNDAGASAYFFDGTSTVELPENVGRGQVPRISGNNIVGIGTDPEGLNDQVFLYDGMLNLQLGNTEGGDNFQIIAGQNVAWLSFVNGEREVFVYEQGHAKQLSFNSVHAYPPVVSESFVVWSADDGDGFDIFVYDGVTTKQLTDDIIADHAPDISGNAIVWTRSGHNVGPEVYMATFVVPEPSASALVLATTLLFLLVGGRRSTMLWRQDCQWHHRRCHE